MTSEKTVEPVRHHALEQRGLVRDQPIQRLGGYSGAARHRLHAGRGVAAGGEFVPRGLVDELAGFIVGADLRAAAAALVLVCGPGGAISAMLLHDACHSIDSPKIGAILENIKFPNQTTVARSPRSTPMTRHSTAFEIERPVPDDAAGCCRTPKYEPATGQPVPAAKKDQFSQGVNDRCGGRLLAGAAWYGWDYWTVGRYLVSTDDAYVKADNTTIAPKVSGYLREVLVGDNERVKAGQVLARIDERDFQVALDQAKADVAAAQAAIASKQAQLDVQQAVIDAAKATIEVDKATVTFAAQENKRYTDLAATGYGSVQNAQQAQSRIAGAEAAIQRDTANLASALKQVDLLKAEIAQAIAALARAKPCRTRPSSISVTPRSSRRSTASSATARCASASSCRPERN